MKYSRGKNPNSHKITEIIKKKISFALKGKIPKNFKEMQKKAWKMPHKVNKGSFKKGGHYSPKTEFKVGIYADENNFHWKGEGVSYSGLHHWVRRKLGRPIKCEHCGETKKIQWANKDHKYKRNLIDWLQLCQRCHKKYDISNNSKLNNKNE